MFGLQRDTTNYVLQKLRDLVLALAFGIVLIASALLTILSTQTLTFLLGVLGVTDSFWTSAAARASGLLGLGDPQHRSRWRRCSGCSHGSRSRSATSSPGRCSEPPRSRGSASSAALLIGGATRNPLLATFAVFVGLLLWFNLISRVLLLSASWIAVGMFDNGISPRIVTPEQEAAERRAAEHSARVLVAQAQLEEAKSALGSAGWYNRLPAQRRVAHAEAELNGILEEGSVGGPR